MKRIDFILIALLVVLIYSVQAHATETTIGTATYNSTDYNLISDDDLGIIWLDYSNGLDNWQNQVNWAAGLNTPDVLTYNLNPGITVSWSDDWRLPSTVGGPYVYGANGATTAGYNITTSEMGYLFYTELGNLGFCSTGGNCNQDGWGLINTGDFQNLIAGRYWSGTEYSDYPDYAWTFYFDFGAQGMAIKDYYGNTNSYALAVRSGDVSTSVPEPATMFLLCSGLVGMAVLRKRLVRRAG